MSPIVKTFFDPDTFTATHVVWDAETKQAAVIDTVWDYDPKSGCRSTASADAIISFIRAQELSVEWILETHAHADHLSAAPYFKEQLGGQIAIGSEITSVQREFKKIFNTEKEFAVDGSQFDHLFEDGAVFHIGDLEVKVIHTPGHTPACVTYLMGDVAFVGDTLFMPDYGTARCDFPGGDVRQLYSSIRNILSLPPDTRLFMCHDYAPGGREFAWQTTVAVERAENIHMHEGITEDEFVHLRTERDQVLDMPVLILPSVQINMRAGHLPPAESNGVHYLKIPIDVLAPANQTAGGGSGKQKRGQ